MKLPNFVYCSYPGEPKNLKECFRNAINRCRDMHSISSPDMQEFWFGRVLKLVRWAEKRWPESFNW